MKSSTKIITASFAASILGFGVGAAAAPAFQSAPIRISSEVFEVTADVVPALDKVDVGLGLSNAVIRTYSDMGPIVRFAHRGVEAFNGTGYESITPVAYKAGVKYHVRMLVRMNSRTYDAFVAEDGQSESIVGLNFKFRSTQADVREFNYLSQWRYIGTAEVERVATKPRLYAPMPGCRAVASTGEILEANPANLVDQLRRVRNGQTLRLAAGVYPKLALNNLKFPDFVSIEGAPGSLPIVRGLTVTNSSGLRISKIKLSLGDDATPPRSELDFVVRIDKSSDNVVLEDSVVSTSDDSSKWQSKDWMTKPYSGLAVYAKSCATVKNNFFQNLRNALAVTNDKYLIAGNYITDYENDGIEFSGTNARLAENSMTFSHHPVQEQLHSDGMQGFPGNNANITIESNFVQAGPQADYQQGISFFDGEWKNVALVNNVVIANAYHGITVFGLQGGVIARNTVVGTAGGADKVWIQVAPAKNGTPSRNVIVRENIAPSLLTAGVDIRTESNLFFKRFNGSSREGSYGTNRVFRSPELLFEVYEPANAKFDLRVKSGSLAAGLGAR